MELGNTDSPRHEFYVHQALVDELCHPLCDELREYWKNFDGETVGRFAQYLYQADCGFPAPLPVETKTETTMLIGAAPDGNSLLSNGPSGISPIASGSIDETPEGAPTYMRPLTPLGDFKIPNLHILPKCSSPAPPETPAGHGYEAVLLAYAKLYILSYSQGIYALSDLCISRLCHKLHDISSPRSDARILGNVVELLRYVYCSPCAVASPKPLRPAWVELQNLASQFCALNIDAMEGNREFMVLLGGGGALPMDVMAKTVRRLRSAEDALAKANKATATAKIDLAKANQAASTAEAALAEATRPTAADPGYKVTPVGLFGGIGSASSGLFGGPPAASAPSHFRNSPTASPPLAGLGPREAVNTSPGASFFGTTPSPISPPAPWSNRPPSVSLFSPAYRASTARKPSQ